MSSTLTQSYPDSLSHRRHYSKELFGSMARGLHMPLPRPQPGPLQRRQSSPAKTHASPLTPSTITPPSVSNYSYYTERTSKDESRLPDSQRASTLLAKVASKHGTPVASPVQTPSATHSNEARGYGAESPASERAQQKTRDSGYWSVSGQQDGYISFPDFERYCQNGGAEQPAQPSAQYHQQRRRKS